MVSRDRLIGHQLLTPTVSFFVCVLCGHGTCDSVGASYIERAVSLVGSRLRSAQYVATSASMGYDWGPYRDICYQLYAVEKRSVEEVADYMKRNHGFTPR